MGTFLQEEFLQDVVLHTVCCASKKMRGRFCLGPLNVTRSLQSNNDTQACSNLSEHPSLFARVKKETYRRLSSIYVCPLLVSDLLRHSAGCHDIFSAVTPLFSDDGKKGCHCPSPSQSLTLRTSQSESGRR